MKKLFGIILIVFWLVQGTYAQDTVRLCQPMPPYPPFGSTDLSHFCPTGPLGSFFFGILNGDTVTSLGSLTTATVGTQGTMEVYCDYIVDGTPDTTFYFIGNAKPQICVISSDSNNHPIIYVDSSTLYGNDVILLQRQVTTTSWNSVASFHPSDPLIIVDSSANTATQSYKYRLSSGACTGYEHTTMHLQSNGNNLIWNEYQGSFNPLRGYYIYKRDVNGNFSLIDSTVSLTYTDINFQNGDEYFVEAYKDDGCLSNSWQKTNSPISVKSNRLKIGTSGIKPPEQTQIKYYVDGSTLFVQMKRIDDIWVHDLLGREIIHQRTDRLTVKLKTGMYLMNVGINGYKIVIN